MALTMHKIVPLHTDGRDPDTFLIVRVGDGIESKVVEEFEGMFGQAKLRAEQRELAALREMRR